MDENTVLIIAFVLCVVITVVISEIKDKIDGKPKDSIDHKALGRIFIWVAIPVFIVSGLILDLPLRVSIVIGIIGAFAGLIMGNYIQHITDYFKKMLHKKNG